MRVEKEGCVKAEGERGRRKMIFSKVSEAKTLLENFTCSHLNDVIGSYDTFTTLS